MPVSCWRAGGAGVGGGVHDGEEVFELFGGREDLQVLESVAGFADEGALELAQEFLGGFGAVLVQRVGPAPGHPGQEVRVVLGRGAGQGVFHPGGGLGVADVPDPVQRQGDDGRGPGRDLPGGDGGAEFPCTGGNGFAGESLPRAAGVPARQSRRRASAALIRSRARRNSVVFRYPSSSTDSGTAGSSRPAHRPGSGGRTAAACRRIRARGAGRVRARRPGAPVCTGGALAPAGGPRGARLRRRRPRRRCFRVRSTAPAATSCRYSTARESSSTRAGEIRRRPEAPQRRVLDRRRTHLPQHARAASTPRHWPGTGSDPAPVPLPRPAVRSKRDEIPDGFHESSLLRGLRQY